MKENDEHFRQNKTMKDALGHLQPLDIQMSSYWRECRAKIVYETTRNKYYTKLGQCLHCEGEMEAYSAAVYLSGQLLRLQYHVS